MIFEKYMKRIENYLQSLKNVSSTFSKTFVNYFQIGLLVIIIKISNKKNNYL